MKKISSAFIILMISVLTIGVFSLTGCGNSSDAESTTEEPNDTEIVGTWAESFFDSGYIFNEDLTGTDTFWDLTFTYTAKSGVIVMTYDDDMWGSNEYTYSITDDVLTMKRNDSEDEFSYNRVAEASTTTASTESGETSSDGDESSESAESETTAG